MQIRDNNKRGDRNKKWQSLMGTKETNLKKKPTDHWGGLLYVFSVWLRQGTVDIYTVY